MLYADTSAIVRAYLHDEQGHVELRQLLLRNAEPVVTSEISRVEFAGAIHGAVRAQRIIDPGPFLRAFDHDCRPGSALSLLPFERDPVLADAYRLVGRHGLTSMDALQLAAALEESARQPSAPFAFVTRDEDQAEAARAEGLRVV